jgi:competence protein ComEA
VSLTSSEQRALLLAAALVVLATVVRATALRDEPGTWRSTLRQVPADSLAAEVRRRIAADARRRAPLAPGERVDPNRASVEELDRLPGVGPALAREIVHARETHGAFLWVEDLERVPGIGPALLARIRDRLDLPARSDAVPPPVRGPGTAAGAAKAADAPPDPAEPLDLNRASAEDLARIPGIGPKRAAQIVAARETRGGFRSVDDLLDVPGIGPKTLARMRPFLRVGP